MKEYIGIICPNSCKIAVEESEGQLAVTGNLCPRGKDFAEKEHINPVRMFTSTVKMEGAWLPRLSVMTSAEVPKCKLMECQKSIQEIVVVAPIKCGDIVVKDLCGLGVDLIATRSFDAK